MRCTPRCSARCAFISIIGLIGTLALGSIGAEASCQSEPVRVGDISFCVRDYGIRSADATLLRFEEQYFVGETRVTDIDPKTLRQSDGTRGTAVLSSVRRGPPHLTLEGVIRTAVERQLTSFRASERVIVNAEDGVYGELHLEFTREAEGRFAGRVISAEHDKLPLDYVFVAFEGASVDYMLGCSLLGKGDRLQYACRSDFGMHGVTVYVSLFASKTDDLDVAFEANRAMITSFVDH